jgi:SAM-dependent methyltransferase
MDLIHRVLRRRPAPPVAERSPKHAPRPRTVLPKEELHAFWRDPDKVNRPGEYLTQERRSLFLLEFLAPYLRSGGEDPSILEIGCNVGRNLAHLHEAGYRRLTGIEINGEALVVLRAIYPQMAASASLINASVEDAIRALPSGSMDIVFTMAVLEHIHPDSEWIFDEIVRVAGSTVVSVEDEQGVSRHHTPRDYRAVFEARGLRQAAHRSLASDSGFSTRFEARAFQRP